MPDGLEDKLAKEIGERIEKTRADLTRLFDDAAAYREDRRINPSRPIDMRLAAVAESLPPPTKGKNADEPAPKPVFVNANDVDQINAAVAFFAGRGNPQIIAGYYDSGDGAKSAQSELNGVRGTAGLMGLMYTTWRGDFSQLEGYAKGARSAW